MTIRITGDFDSESLSNDLRKRALQVVNARLTAILTNQRCPRHEQEGSVTVRFSELDRINLEVHPCCDAYSEQLESTLREAGASQLVEEAITQRPTSSKLNPTAFLSHSHADKPTIVNPLDEALRQRGVRPWLDTRDMPAGSNLVDRIFGAGISGSDAFIVILTPSSIESTWVHEELSVAVVRKIQQNVKLIIPVLYEITDDAVPDPLVATRWIRLSDTSAGEMTLCAQEIAIGLFGALPPPVAEAPEHAGIPVHRLPNISADDERIFAEIYRRHMAAPYFHPRVSTTDIVDYAENIGLTKDSVVETFQVLEQHGYLAELGYYLGSGPVPQDVSVSEYGIETYLALYLPQEYATAKRAIISEIVNKRAHSSFAIKTATGVSDPMVHHILQALQSAGHLSVRPHGGGDAAILAKATLRRLLD